VTCEYAADGGLLLGGTGGACLVFFRRWGDGYVLQPDELPQERGQLVEQRERCPEMLLDPLLLADDDFLLRVQVAGSEAKGQRPLGARETDPEEHEEVGTRKARHPLLGRCRQWKGFHIRYPRTEISIGYARVLVATIPPRRRCSRRRGWVRRSPER